ncbi:MAG: hypothetical protein KAT68_16625 [Bacteroidales bacterium]|nr:hypothetical protein [Bacteroidales bacterium]
MKIKFTTLLSFILINISIAQIPVLKELNVDENLLSNKDFILFKESETNIKLEKDIVSKYFNKVVINIRDGLSIIDLYNTDPTKEQIQDICEMIFNKYGKDKDGNKAYSKKDLEMFQYGIVPHRIWDIDSNTSLLMSYQNKVQILNDYGGLVCTIYCKDKNISKEVIKNNNTGNDFSKEEFTFRKTKWKMTVDEVKFIEGNPDDETENYIIYNNQLIGNKYKAKIAYIFIEDKLVRSKYILNDEHTNKNQYVLDFMAVTNILENKYGKPIEKDFLWKNDLYKGDTDDYGFAVSIGHLIIYYKWRTKYTDITAQISGDNYEILSQIEYKSRLLSQLEEEKDKKQLMDDF